MKKFVALIAFGVSFMEGASQGDALFKIMIKAQGVKIRNYYNKGEKWMSGEYVAPPAQTEICLPLMITSGEDVCPLALIRVDPSKQYNGYHKSDCKITREMADVLKNGGFLVVEANTVRKAFDIRIEERPKVTVALAASSDDPKLLRARIRQLEDELADCKFQLLYGESPRIRALEEENKELKKRLEEFEPQG